MKTTKQIRKVRNRPRIYETRAWPRTYRRILENVRKCHVIERAVHAAGLSKAVWYKYQAMADEKLALAQAKADRENSDDVMAFVEPDDKIYVEFVEEIRRVQNEQLVNDAGLVRKAGRKDWRAALEILARVDHENYGRRDVVRQTNLNVDTSKIDLSKLSDKELAMYEKLTAKASGS